MKRKLYIGVAATVALGFIGVLLWLLTAPMTVRYVHFGGVKHVVVLPAPALQSAAGTGTASFYVLGDRDLAAFLQERAPRRGWRYGEQLGSTHSLYKPGFVARISRQQQGTSLIVRIDIEISSR